jgi:2-dehydro-3-deoxygalactonokinase
VLERRRSESGMGGLSRDGFEPALLELVGDVLRDGRALPVICCGMVGSRQGWAEAPYASVPCAPPGIAQATLVRSAEPRIAAYILPGIKQAAPADVMRGEETQIAGILTADPGFDGILCLPGTHTKWAHISAGEIVSFRTFMTGEMFALLGEQSVLRHSVADAGWDAAAFDAAVAEAMSRPERAGGTDGTGAALGPSDRYGTGGGASLLAWSAGADRGSGCDCRTLSGGPSGSGGRSLLCGG